MHPINCSACKIIDQMDGDDNGRIFAINHWSPSSSDGSIIGKRRPGDRFAGWITKVAGSISFVVFHLFWFGFWVLDNSGALGSGLVFDESFGLLTMIVSLEAIFLSALVMIGQNRQAAQNELRSQTDFESNLRSLIWTIHIAEALKVDAEHVKTLCDSAINELRNDLAANS